MINKVIFLTILGLSNLFVFLPSAQAQFLPINVDLQFPNSTSSPTPNQSSSPSPSSPSSPQPTPVNSSTPTSTPTPTQQPTPAPFETPPPALFIDDPEPTFPPFQGSPEVVRTVALPQVFDQIREQIEEDTAVTDDAPTPGEIITPIIPRGVFERIIPSGLYKEDGLNPIDGIALFIFGVGFLLAGVALLKPNTFLPALVDFELWLKKKQLWRGVTIR